MSVDQDLLWKAWPGGYLAVRGVSTVGGWLCLGETEAAAVEFISNRHNGAHKIVGFCAQGNPLGHDELTPMLVGELRIRGVLLPSVDPTDTVTWAAIKRDLATACGAPSDASEITWRRMNMGTDGAMVWMLSWEDKGSVRASVAYQFGIDTDDPALAIVIVRAHVHEQEGR